MSNSFVSLEKHSRLENPGYSEIATFNDKQLIIHMVAHESIVQSGIQLYRDNYDDCEIEFENSVVKPESILQHYQMFLKASVCSYLTLGFVVFRFHEITNIKHKKFLIPVIVPISEINWQFATNSTKYFMQIPEVCLPHSNSQSQTRYYVFKFKSNDGVVSSELGVLGQTLDSYRQLVIAREYSHLIRYENMKKTIFVEEHNSKFEVNASHKTTLGSVNSRDLLSDISNDLRILKSTTTESTEESREERMKMSIDLQFGQLAGEMHPVDIIVMPTNTSVTPYTRNLQDIQLSDYKEEFETNVSTALCVISSLTSSSVTTKSTHNNMHSNQNSQSSVQKPNISSDPRELEKSMFLAKRIKLMNAEFEILLATITLFCESGNAETQLMNFEKYSSDKNKHHNFASNFSRAIPIQILLEHTQPVMPKVRISAHYSSEVVFSNVLYRENLLSQELFLEMFKDCTGMKFVDKYKDISQSQESDKEQVEKNRKAPKIQENIIQEPKTKKQNTSK